jgi:hypothetical protein
MIINMHERYGNNVLSGPGRQRCKAGSLVLPAALLYLVQAEVGEVDAPLLRCRKILLESLAKAAGRSVRGRPGNILWALLARFKAAAERLPSEGRGA